ncbi:helix-turn-helix domain-containing protein [Halopseudomonas aestusnigri]|uniref:MarR family transcriptional regulator n=1 Tax=Halopseudomonas aestusnigri TaxID=857252 RepID=UPI0028C2F2D2|nr:hypothetical protein YSKK_22680 [Halopseudomonas aestusnigri]
MRETTAPSDIDILLAQIGCRAAAKWLLIRLMRALGGRASHSIRVVDICDQLEIGQESFFKALNDLAQNKAVFMRLEQLPAAKAGRPARLLSYGVGARLKASVGLEPKSGVVHEALCSVVLQAESDSSRFPLSKACLLQLAFLLAMADRCGFVDGVTTSEICRALGTSRSSVARNFNLLTRLGFVRRTIPGFKGSRFLGEKASLHVINLTHPSYENIGEKSITFVSLGLSSVLSNHDFPDSLTGGNYFDYDIAWWLVDFAKITPSTSSRLHGKYAAKLRYYERHFQWLFGIGVSALCLVLPAFYESETVCSEHIFQTILEKYASSLLTRRWRELSGTPPRKVDDQLLRQIRADFYPVYKGWAAGALRRQVRFERFVFRLAWGIAKLYRLDIERMTAADFDQDASIPYENVTFRIMPTAICATNPSVMALAGDRRKSFLNRERWKQPMELQGESQATSINSCAQARDIWHRRRPDAPRWETTVFAVYGALEESECRVSDHAGRRSLGYSLLVPNYHPRVLLSEWAGLIRARFPASQLTIADACSFGLLSIDGRQLAGALLDQEVLPRLLALPVPREK